jgi:hypothetical protein
MADPSTLVPKPKPYILWSCIKMQRNGYTNVHLYVPEERL